MYTNVDNDAAFERDVPQRIDRSWDSRVPRLSRDYAALQSPCRDVRISDISGIQHLLQ
jgi:hypothetical protein